MYVYLEMSWSTKRFVSFLGFIYLFCSYINVCFQLVAFVIELPTQVSSSSLSTPLTRPSTIYVLLRKQQAGNIDICKNKKKILKNANHFVDVLILKYFFLSLD